MKYEENQSKMHLDADFFGITTLFESDAKDKTPVVDIIAVVGLGTNAFSTFRAPDGDKMWLRDFLREDIGDMEIRVLVYEYEAPVDKSRCVDTIDLLASRCLDQIIEFRDETENNPIIFLGQSLGGLIVQRVMCDAERDKRTRPESKQILKHWHSLIGFGISRTGLDNEILKARAINQPNKQPISQLVLDENGTGPKCLERLADIFGAARGCCYSVDPEIMYYRENLLSQPKLPIGQKSSGPILMVKYEYERLPQDYESDKISCRWLHADHSKMVKYASNSDQNYKTVRHVIKNMIRSAKQKDWH